MPNSELQKAFDQFSLNAKEARLYLAALELGPSAARMIAKKAGVQRTHFYDLSDRLIQLGFLKQSKRGKRRLFAAAEPDTLLEYQERRLRELKKTLPQLRSLFNTGGQRPAVSYYEGREGIDQINNDTLRYHGEMVGFTTPRFLTADQQRLSREYIRKRVALGNRVRILGELCPEILELKKRDKTEFRETRILPRELYSSEVEVAIYGNKVYVADYREEFGLIIEGSEIANTLKRIFEIVWESGKVIS